MQGKNRVSCHSRKVFAFRKNSTVPHISINLPLGRIAIGHTAVPGLHLQQDEVTRLWVIASQELKVTHRMRLSRALQFCRSSKWLVAGSAGVAGVVLALIAGQISGASLFHRNPVVSLQAAPLSTTSIDVAPVAYAAVQPSPSAGLVLPPPAQDPSPILQMPLLPEAAAIGMPSPVLNGAQGVKQLAVVTKQPVKDDSSMSIFNEPLQAKPVAANQVTGAVAVSPQTPGRSQAVVLTQSHPENPAKNGAQARAQVNTPVSQSPAINTAIALRPPESAAPHAIAPNGKESQAEGSRPTSAQQTSILAVPNSDSIVVTNTTTRLPMVVKVGERLPDGSVLKSVDKSTSSATTSRGETLSLR